MKRRVLIVDDDPEIPALLTQQLEATGGYDVVGLTSSAHVLPTARSWRPDVIIMDLLMPGIGGTHVAALLDAEDPLRRIPIIFLTGVVTEEVAIKSGAIGHHQCLNKPVHLHTLLLGIETACTANAERPSPSTNGRRPAA